MKINNTVYKMMVVAGLALGAALPSLAHHAFSSEFDEKRPVKLEGKVTKVELINPHSWIHIEVTDATGKATPWMIEGGSPNSLFRNGFTKKSLEVGTVIVVDGYQAKDGANRAVGKDLTLKNGSRLFLGGSAPGANGPGK
jgi:Family of unknown function (DUF6152)